MTLREIKMQALRLMHANVQIVNDADVEGLEFDSNYGPLYAGMPAAINRCFADIEARHILPPKRVLLTDGEVRGSRCRFSLEGIEDFSEVAYISCEKGEMLIEEHPFTYEEENVIRVDGYDESASYYLYYHRAIPRVWGTTKNSEEVPLPDALAVAVPWFVMSEIFRVDEPGEANDGRNHYEAAVEQYAALRRVRRQGAVKTVFGY